ncbi:MAG: acylphosphatase [Nitrospinota bacterium]
MGETAETGETAEISRAHIIVKGMVQGVFYRSSTAERAIMLGLRGWVKNLRNGDVEAVAEGRKDKVEKLIEWCHEGPPLAKISAVNVEWGKPTGEFDAFEITY